MRQGNRTLVLCFDGTSNEFDDTNTNVVKLCAALQMSNRDEQMVYYQPGIGTWTAPGIHGHIQRWVAKTVDLAIAYYLSGHVMGGYEFLMDNHLPGDRICIFGFSRGAYTARALAGMLHCVGLLPKGNQEQVPFAYRMYKDSSTLAPSFKETFCKSVDIEFLGVWDTVASVGLLIPRTLPFVSNDTIKTFRHAVSLDEHRTKFGVTLWKPESEVTDKKANNGYNVNTNSSVEEVWFSGGHCDVGGGSVINSTQRKLCNISFRWMLNQIVKAKCGILFDDKGLDKLQVPYDCVPRGGISSVAMKLGHSTEATAVGEEEPIKGKGVDNPAPIMPWAKMDRLDAEAPQHDALKETPIWWFLQIPCWTGSRIDWCGQRLFPKDEKRKGRSSIHWTVRERIKSIKGYKPRAALPQDWEESFVSDPVGQ